MRKKNIFRKSSTNVPYRGYKVRGKIIPQRSVHLGIEEKLN
jgi:hypothetical protein